MIYLPHTNKPPYGFKLNRTHPLAQGLLAAWVFNEGGGSTVYSCCDIANGVFHSTYPPTWEAYGLDFSSDPRNGVQSTSPPTALPQCVAAGLQLGGVSGSLGIANAKVGSASAQCLLADRYDGHIAIIPTESGSAGRMTTTVFAPWIQHNVVGLRESLKVYVDGNDEAVEVDTNNYSGVIDNVYTIGSREPGSYSRGFEGKLSYVYFWDRELTPVEIVSLNANPYQIFEPLFIPSVVISTGSTLLPNKLNQGQTIDSLDLIQQHVLGINPINQAQSSESPNLIQANVIIINSIDQPQVLDNLDLIQSSTVIINDSPQSQNIDNIDLQVGGTLLIQDSDQPQSSDNIDLTQAHIVVINDISQPQSVDNITLSTDTILQIAKSVQGQNIDIINLIPQYDLSIDSVEQSQQTEQITLDIGVILGIAEIIQNQSSDNLDLTQSNFLGIDQLDQGQVIDNIVFKMVGDKLIITLTIKTPGIDMTIKTPGIDLDIQ